MLPGKVYPCVYLGKQEFQTLPLPEGCRRFVLIRDLRDTLISAYFSIRHSHKVDNPLVNKWRIVVSRLNEEEGILYLMEVWLNLCGNVQRSWLEAGETVFRLEDCMKDAVGSVTQMFQTGWGLPVDAASLKAVVSKHSFEKLSGGRKRGSEDIASHYRKGIQGDWQNHFTPAVTRRFKVLYNDLLVMGGYEKDANWRPDQPLPLQP